MISAGQVKSCDKCKSMNCVYGKCELFIKGLPSYIPRQLASNENTIISKKRCGYLGGKEKVIKMLKEFINFNEILFREIQDQNYYVIEIRR